MRFLSLLMFLFAVGCAGGCAGNPHGVSDTIYERQVTVAETVAKTAKVTVTCEGMDVGSGSGVLYNQKFVITAHHVADAPKDCEYTAQFGIKVYKAKVLLAHPELDVAILQLESAPPIDSATTLRTAHLGEHILVTGFPVQLPNSKMALAVFEGTVGVYNWTKSMDRITAPVYFGNSGGPVWDDDNNLVGIVVALYAIDIPELWRYPIPYDGNGGMIPVRYFKTWLESNAKTL